MNRAKEANDVQQLEKIYNSSESDSNKDMLLKGIDLSGYNLKSESAIYSSFKSPFPVHQNDQPSYYRVDSKELDNHMKSNKTMPFKNDLIYFYMFYVMVGSQAQLEAAKALTERGWCYSNKYNKWLVKKDEIWYEFDAEKWDVQNAVNFNPAQADFKSL